MKSRFLIDQSCLLVVDVQGRLAQMMHKKKQLFAHIKTMISAAKMLDIPIHWFEQYPKGLGPTVPAIQHLLDGAHYHEKITFSACGDAGFNDAIQDSGRKHFVVIGIEAHVCVYQTVLDLLSKGYAVKVNQQAVSARDKANKKLALDNMKDHGAELTSTEMILFEWMQSATHPMFKSISSLIK